MILRPRQLETVTKSNAALKQFGNTLVVAPTGAGKTVILSKIAGQFPSSLILQHRDELIQQNLSTFLKVNPGTFADVFTANRKRFLKTGATFAMVQTLMRPQNLERISAVDALIIDECFIAGTLIDGRPIEEIGVGDLVDSYSHATELVEKKMVKAVFVTPIKSNLIRVKFSNGKELTCTKNHPFWIEQFGAYLPASDLTCGDMVLCTMHELPHVPNIDPESHQESERLTQGEGPSVLQEGVRNGVFGAKIVGDDGGHESQTRIRQDEEKQSHVATWLQREDEDDAACYWTQAVCEGWKWGSSAVSRAITIIRAWLGLGDSGKHQRYQWPSLVRENRHRQCSPESWNRSRWGKPWATENEGGRPQETGFLRITGLEDIEIHERSSEGKFAGVRFGGYVYNFEVEGNNNYFANGVLVHNCHHSAASGYRAIIEKCRAVNPNIKILGVTATPMRADKKALIDIFNNVCDVVKLAELIKAGHLVRPRVYVIDSGLREDLNRVRVTASDFDMDEVGKIMDKLAINSRVVEEWRKLAQHRSTVVFCSTVEHATHVTEAFVNAGVICEMVHGAMPDAERRAVLRRLDNMETQVVVNVAVLTEGFDCQPVSCVILLRPCSHKSTMLQMIGRGLRRLDPVRYPGILKDDCVAEGQMVLTDTGLVAIEDVTLEMKVWDGVDFVSHCGIEFRGYKETIEYAGLIATPDHKVWTKQGWKQIQECAEKGIPICVTGNEGVEIRESDGNFRGRDSRKRSRGGISAILKYCLRGVRKEGAKGGGHIEAKISWLSKMRKKKKFFQAVSWGSKMANYAMRFSQAAVREFKESSILKLWSQGDKIQIQVPEFNGPISYGSLQYVQGTSNRPNRQQWSLRSWKHSSHYGKNQHEQSKAKQGGSWNALIQKIISIGEICGQNNCSTYFRRIFFSRNKRPILQAPIIKTKRRVWDILNAGPRHRFTCEGLLVSNCVVLDFGYSILTHGNLDVEPDLSPERRTRGAMPCKNCGTTVPPDVNECPVCGEPLFDASRGGGGPIERGDLEEFQMTEVDLLELSPYRWEEMWDGVVTVANALTGWAVVVAYKKRWITVGGLDSDLTKDPAKFLANSPTRMEALSAADDFLRDVGDQSGAKKTESWLSMAATDKQLFMLRLDPITAFGTNRYRATCLITWKLNETKIRAAVEQNYAATASQIEDKPDSNGVPADLLPF